ncbi:hypothetical protein [Rivularia sp. UHCC 0363]|nr:hypothetical protein [Rivularia sp. UHCC 0363]MEA5595941.1 hypothetical protein [Rivularia sp. UHCC 0363]
MDVLILNKKRFELGKHIDFDPFGSGNQEREKFGYDANYEHESI